MNEVNKTLYIPLYGKSEVSKKGIILNDPTAEKIWQKEGFELKGKSKSKWLTYYMGMRSAVFDNWVKDKISENSDAIVIHIGCGMDSRINRIGDNVHMWYDLDFPDVIDERKKYYEETNRYKMVKSDARNTRWLSDVPSDKTAVIIMEGVSMYFQPDELYNTLSNLSNHFHKINLLMDCYTGFSAKASKYKNPINDVGVKAVTGFDNPNDLAQKSNLDFICERTMTPIELINQLKGFEKLFFKTVFGGKASKKMYRLYEFKNEV